MSAKLLVLLACVALAQRSAGGLVRRQAADTNAVDWQKHAQDFEKIFKEGLEKLTSSQDTQAVQKSLKEGADTVVTQISSLAQSVQNALGDANGKAKETLEQVRASLEKSASDLRQAHPEVEQEAHQLKEKLQAAVANTLQESQKLAKEINSLTEEAKNKLAPPMKAAYDDFVKQAQEVQKKISEAATKQQ